MSEGHRYPLVHHIMKMSTLTNVEKIMTHNSNNTHTFLGMMTDGTTLSQHLMTLLPWAPLTKGSTTGAEWRQVLNRPPSGFHALIRVA